MSSVSVPGDDRSEPGEPRGRVYDALVGRRMDGGASMVLALLNLMGFMGYGLMFQFWLLGAAMGAGRDTPAMERWFNGMLWSLGIGAAACLYTGVMLAARKRWPRGVQLLAASVLVAVVLLYVLAPPGINSPRPRP